jgi:hypothetical protein
VWAVWPGENVRYLGWPVRYVVLELAVIFLGLVCGIALLQGVIGGEA